MAARSVIAASTHIDDTGDLKGSISGTIRFPVKEREFMSDEKQSSGFSWFLAGLGLGALLGVLYAPKSGRETREELASSAREGTEYLKQRSREAADQVNVYVDRGKTQVNEYVDRSKEYVDRGKSQLNDWMNQGKQYVNEQGGRVSAAVEAGKQAYRTTTGTTTEPAPSQEPTHS
jgi:gas vesicle protein